MRSSRDDYGRRVLSLLAGVVGMLGVGSIYAISAWNAELKALLHFSQAGISTVSSMALLGAYLSYFPGIVFDRAGPFTSILSAGVGLAVVHAFLYAALIWFPGHVGPFTMGACLFVVGQLSAFVIFATMVTNEGIFGDANRGKVMAILTSAYSCGGAVCAYVFNQAFDQDVPGYFAFLGVFLSLACIFGWRVLFHSSSTRRLSDEIVDGNVAVAVLDCGEKTALLSMDVTGMQLFQDARFWLLFVPVLIVIGAGLFVMSNVAFIVESLGGATEQVPLMVALFSISNTACRLATGALSDLVLPTYPRALFAGISVIMTAITQVIFLSIPSSLLVVPVVLAGMAEGVMFGTFPVIIREAFGIKHYGKNYGLISLANCIGYPLFYSPISSYFYQRAAVRQPDGVQKCLGHLCFAPVFWLITALCGVALICCVALLNRQWRTQRRYHVCP